MTRPWIGLLFALLIVFPVCGQDSGAADGEPLRAGEAAAEGQPAAEGPRRGELPKVAPPAGEERDEGWGLRLTGEMGGAYFSYGETLSSQRVKSDFDAGSFALQTKVELNLSGFSPYLGVGTLIASGGESARLTAARQKNDLSIATLLLDLGFGFRAEVGESVTLVPFVGYTFDFMSFERSEFQINGAGVIPLDFDGNPQREVGETILGHGASLGLGVEFGLTNALKLDTFASYTFLPDVEVDNDLGGEVSSEGYMLRAGVGASLAIQRISIRGTIQVGSRELDKSKPRIVSGSVSSAIVQFPESSTLWVFVGVGVQLSF